MENRLDLNGGIITFNNKQYKLYQSIKEYNNQVKEYNNQVKEYNNQE